MTQRVSSSEDGPSGPLPLMEPPRKRGIFVRLRGAFFAGLVVITPIGVTFWLLWTFTGWIDSWVLPLVPGPWRPEHYIGINLRGIGVLFFLLFTVVIGWFARGYVGRSALRFSENLVNRMPIIRSVYGTLKQIAETILSQTEARFDRAALIEYPRKGSYAVGFVAGAAQGEIAAKSAQKLVAIFVPTTPNPTSGFLIYLPEDEIQYLDMGVESAAKLIISAGLVYPDADGKLVPRE